MSIRDAKTREWHRVYPSQYDNMRKGSALEDFKELRAFSCHRDGSDNKYIRLHFSNGASCAECEANAVFDMHVRFKRFGTDLGRKGRVGRAREVELTWLKRWE